MKIAWPKLPSRHSASVMILRHFQPSKMIFMDVSVIRTGSRIGSGQSSYMRHFSKMYDSQWISIFSLRIRDCISSGTNLSCKVTTWKPVRVTLTSIKILLEGWKCLIIITEALWRPGNLGQAIFTIVEISTFYL